MGPVPAWAGRRVTVTKLLGLSGEENIRYFIRDLITITGRNHFGMGSKHFFLIDTFKTQDLLENLVITPSCVCPQGLSSQRGI